MSLNGILRTLVSGFAVACYIVTAAFDAIRWSQFENVKPHDHAKKLFLYGGQAKGHEEAFKSDEQAVFFRICLLSCWVPL